MQSKRSLREMILNNSEPHAWTKPVVTRCKVDDFGNYELSEPVITLDDFNDWLNKVKQNIDALEAKAVSVHLISDSTGYRIWKEGMKPTHQGLLVMLEPLEKGVSVSEIIEILKLEGAGKKMFGINNKLGELIERIESEGIKGVKE